MRNICRLGLGFFLPTLLLISCGNDQNIEKNAKTKLLELISTNKKVVSFGKIDLKGLIDKSEVDDLPKVGVLVNTFKEIYRYVNLEDSLYFANEIVDDKSINSYFFVDVSNKDSLVDFFKGMGLNFEEKENLYVYSSSQFSLAINDQTCVLGTNNIGEVSKLKTFEILNEKNISGDTSTIPQNILNSNSDIVVGISLASTLNELNDPLTNKNTNKLFDNNFIQSQIQFNKGNIHVKTNNIFSKDLLSKAFFNKSDGSWAQKLIEPNTNVAYALNIDVVRFLNFMGTINPSFNEQFSFLQLFENIPLKNNNDFQEIFDGRMAYILNEYPNLENEFGDMSLFLGLGKEGQQLINLYRLMVEENDFVVNEVNNGVLLSTMKKTVETKNIYDSRFLDFGKKGISFFIDFKKLRVNNLPEDINLDYITDLNYATFEMDFQGSNLILFTKESNKNVLSVLTQSIVKSLFQNENLTEKYEVI
jgi:hypothetical protein